MGNAFTSIADDGSALFYNPAGIAFQPGLRLQMDSLVVVGLFRFFPSETPPGTVVPSNGYSGSVKPHFIPVASLYFSKSLSDRLSLGFGSFTPFGLADNFTNFNDGDPAVTKYPGRFAGTRGKLESFWFQPTVAYRLTPNSSVALGVALVHTHLLIEQSFLNPRGEDGLEFGRETAETIFPGVDKEQAARSIARMLPEGRSRVAGTANSPGFNLGYLYKHPSGTNLGLMFRSAVTSHLKGKASFAFQGPYPLEKFVGSDLLPKAFPTQDITGSFTTPATYAIGVSNSKVWNSTIAVDFRLQDYRRFRSVPLNFSKTEATDPDVRTPAERRLTFDFRDSFQLAVGLEKRLSEKMAVRAGYQFDRSPVVDKSVGPLFPDNNRHSFTVGASQKKGNKEFTLFYQAVKFVDRTVNVAANANLFTNGDYRSFAHLAGLGLRFEMPGKK